MMGKVIPQMSQYLVDTKDSTKVMRPAVALAIAKILNLYPHSIALHLPPLLTSIISLMQ